MSRARRLSIRGVRNFGDETEQIIRFTRPLTLIIGQNGVGKTTVIEALRYATTGEFPPGSERGKGFIHDPRLKKSVAQVRGVVKAEFIDKNNEIVTVRRTIESSKKVNTLTFKTVENTISKIDKLSGEEFQINQRCADIDKEITSSLGLTPAILNNVIFCHQDDSNWPMDDCKKLKDRFDEIFDTTQYNKAIELLRKTIKLKTAEVKEFQLELNALSILVSEVTLKETKLQEYTDRRSQATENIEKLICRLEPVRQEISQKKSDEVRYATLTNDKEKKDVELNLAKQKYASLKQSIKDLFSGSNEELEAIVQSYDEGFEEKNSKITKIESTIQDLTQNESKIYNSCADQKVNVGILRQQLQDQARKIKDRNLTLNEILRSQNLEKIDDKTSEEIIQNSVEEVISKLHKLEEDVNEMRQKHDKKEAELDKSVNLSRNERAKIDFELKQSQKEITELREQIKVARARIAKGEDDLQKLEAVNAKLERVSKQVDEISLAVKQGNFSQKIVAKERELEKQELESAKIDILLSKMQDASSLKVKFENLTTEINVKWREIDELKKKHGDSIKKLLGVNEVPSSQLKDRVNRVHQTLNERLVKLKQEIASEQSKATTLETTINHAKKEFNAKIGENQRDKERIMTHCPDYNNFEEHLLLVSNEVKKLQNKRGMYAYQGVAYATYVEKLSSEDPCCPLCDRGFEQQEGALKVIENLNQDLKNHPKRLKSCEDELNSLRTKHDTLLSLKTTVEKVIKFDKEEREKMSSNIAAIQKQLEAKNSRITELQLLTGEPEKKILMCNNLSGDLALWDKCLVEVEKLQDTHEEVQVQVIELGLPDKTIEEVRSENEACKQKIKKLRDEIGLLREQSDKMNNNLREATNARSSCLEEQLQVLNEVQEVKQLQENLNKWVERESCLRENLQKLGKQLVEADGKLDEVVRLAEEVKVQNREQQDRARKRLQEFTKQVDKLMNLQTDVSNLLAKKIGAKLKNLEEEMRDNEKLLADIKEEVTGLEEKLVGLKEDISCHEMKRRNLQDNRELRTCEKSIRLLSQEKDNLKSEIQGINIEKVRQDLQSLQQRVVNLEKEINIARGTQQELNLNIEHLNSELQKEEYYTAKMNYKRKWLEKSITEDALKDMGVYCTVLDAAMSKYHEDRMTSVNKSMRNLWNHIYNGSDTSSIQIRTEAANTAGASNRRSFNYRLVQIKHGEEIEMRGRCSAGQRVLASIVIRLALAETFCDQCSMLALDEPTTNLDEGNSASLAETLFNYVMLRSKYQKSFQLIIITHDEHFIKKLSQLNTSSGFYHLYRNDKGLTQIQYLVFDKEEAAEQDTAPDDGQSDDEQKKAAKKNTSVQTKKRQAPTSNFPGASKKPYEFSL
ncbi:GSCOCG00004077001-RA-CDS [Cotesia congregata]|uniref:Similar to RAD50: DNA repair protein RAD50 (Homo sapiens) n=1 Tax=Cotesia congregata TaxID=51543 RepID=A0A8J2MKG0_COTCN|nr:GSCOCG00004077001-RA-CDS [Cotesia congregata]CAG5082218.1 Similar to RAD50: DNA repair protein RAD50 (Homo sapiens) [Cotesia congregata]